MTFKGAFQSFQTVLIPCTDTSGRRWARARPTSPLLLPLHPRAVGYKSRQLRCSPPQGIHCLCSLFPSHPSLPWIFLSCWAAPSRGSLFLWPWAGSLGFGPCWVCVFRKQHLLPPPVIFPLGRESRQRRGRGSGGRDNPSSAGKAQPWLREGTASACSSSESLQGPPWPWGPVGPVRPVPPVPSGCSGSPACSRSCWLLAEETPSSGSCSQAAADDSPPCSSFPGPFLPSPAGSGAPPSLGLPVLCPCPVSLCPRVPALCPCPQGAALEQGFPRILAFLPLLMLFGSHPV